MKTTEQWIKHAKKVTKLFKQAAQDCSDRSPEFKLL